MQPKSLKCTEGSGDMISAETQPTGQTDKWGSQWEITVAFVDRWLHLSLSLLFFKLSLFLIPPLSLFHTLFEASYLHFDWQTAEANPHYSYWNASVPQWISYYEQSQSWALPSFENLFASAIYTKPHFASLTAHIQNPAARKTLVT